ncbi:hypothetical protein [Cypionkella sp.]|uniref:hypothetical protein n=1 Tax=Cypionkella sp. TaxID=2811411 RepID=UPI00271B9589|nr:hypothetical protein [Cypionkella sp.]MDO8983026.1 hypothetical protein [Cypionkella sp.]
MSLSLDHKAPEDTNLSPLELAERKAGIKLSAIHEDFDPQSADQFALCLMSWTWRIFSGRIYKITTKGDDSPDDEPDIVVDFRPNNTQREFLANLHERNTILKARQMGFSTLIEIMALDHALFNDDQEVVVIAHTKQAATKLYRKKVCFAYDKLPQAIRDMCPTVERNQTQMVFANGSSIEVTSSARGGTPHFLHISEFGKIAAKYPDKAVEITTGAIQGVPRSGFIFIESTAEGQSGAFYDNAKRAQSKAEAKQPLTQSDYRFHFFAWYRMPEYRTIPEEIRHVRINAKEHEYFDTVEGLMDCEIDLGQRAWYISKRDNDFATTPDLMWREYPSTPEECWQASNEGKYYAKALALARREGRIGRVPLLRHVPCNTFWDLGASDSTAIWVHQRVGVEDRFLRYYEESGAGYLAFTTWLDSLNVLWGSHYLPHDAEQKRQKQQADGDDFALISPVMILREMKPSWDFKVVPRIQNLQHGIDQTRLSMQGCYWDDEGCKEGLMRLENYSREWNTRLQCWHDHPKHDDASHGSDAFRQFSTGYIAPISPTVNRRASKATSARRATGMTA